MVEYSMQLPDKKKANVFSMHVSDQSNVCPERHMNYIDLRRLHGFGHPSCDCN